MPLSTATTHPPRGFVLQFPATPQVLESSPGALTTFDAPDAQVQHEHLTAWCYGEILSYRPSCHDTQTCVRQALLDLQAGKLAYDRLNGRFVLLIWDSARREWHVVTDRLGAMHCYWVRQGDRIVALGSDLATLVRLASTKALNWEALCSFFAFGFFLDDQTHFSDVTILPPHSVFRIGSDGTLRQQQRYWQWQHTVLAGRTYDETLETYDMLLRQAVRRCTSQGEVVLPLSGGLDSRSLAAVADEGAVAQAYSYGYTGASVEIKLAGQVARHRRLAFSPQVIDSYLFNRLEEIVLAVHGSQDVTQARQASVSGWLREHADALLTGLWGDVWCDQMGLAAGLDPDLTLAQFAVRKFEKRGSQWLIEKLCQPALGKVDVSALLTDRVAQGLAPFGQIEDADFRLKAYKTAQWAFRWSNASLRAFDLGAAPRMPYYDVDVVDFFCSVPTDFVRGRRLQIDHLKRVAPPLARIRWQQAEANLYLARYGYWLSLPRRLAKRVYNVATGQRPLQRNWELQFLTLQGEAQLRTWLLRSQSPLLESVAPGAIEDLLARFYARPDAANGYTVSMLLTFAAWLESVTG